ncbi:MAG: ABC transporter substrate-binding protein [bacterium]|nr:ABC transporter substrate-binding protein [bacterium]
MKKKLISMLMILVVAAIYLTGCGDSDSKKASNDGTKKGKVYYLSFKPESDQIWQNIAKEYQKEKGIEVKVVTAANGTYEQTLKSEIAKSDAPTLFQINGPVGYQNWKDHCLDLKDTDLYSWLIDKNMAVKDGDGVYGIPYVVEGYGIIYNEEIMDKYFALSDKAVDINSTSEIKSFDMLKKVAEDMTAKKDKLGIEGVFASTSLLPGDDWRWQTHLANLPIYYEYKDKGINDTDKLEFKYAENFKNIFDLYINNSCTKPQMLGSKSVVDSMAEFALGKVAMVQNGNWGWSQIAETKGNVVKEDKVKFLPIYTGMPEEEKQGLCIGTENFFCINSKASKEDQQASIDFIQWLYNSDYGKKTVTNDLKFISPFSTFKDDEKPTDPLAKEVIKYMSDTSLNTVSWNFTSFPSQTFKDNFGAGLLQYANGKESWDDLKAAVIKDWEAEKTATK